MSLGAIATALAATVTATGAAAQSRETLETKVTGEGSIITLKWGKKHPWDAELLARGAALMVEYATGNGQVGVDCFLSSSAPGADRTRRGVRGNGGSCGVMGVKTADDERSLRFRLPDRLTAPPRGDVCLYFQLANRRILPLRRADDRGRETARFSFESWSNPLRHTAEVAAVGARREQIARDIEVKREDVRRQREINDRNGWSAEGCASIQAPKLQGAGKRTRPVAAPGEYRAVASQVCVMRLANADRVFARQIAKESFAVDRRAVYLLSERVHGPATLDYVFSLLPKAMENDPAVIARRAQAVEFRNIWNRYAPLVDDYVKAVRDAGYPEPHFGAFHDRLSIQTMATEVGAVVVQAIRQGAPAESQHLLGYIGATLDAATRCISDGEAQLATAFEANEQLEERSPQLAEAARQQLVRSCNAGVAKLAELERELAALEAEQRTIDAKLAELSATQIQPGSTRQELNMLACGG